MNDRKTRACPESLNILRLLVLLSLLSHRCQGMTMSEIREYLQKRRLPASNRQLQRDMQLLSTHFGIESECDDEDPNCKRWLQKPPAMWRSVLSPAPPGTADRGCDPFAPDASESCAMIVHTRATQVPGRVLRLIRILLIVESLPDDDEGACVDTADIVKMARSQGLNITMRTIQRDLLFVREHFLVLVRSDGNRKSLWTRIDGGLWEESFEPRFPRNDSIDHPAVHHFLYRMPPPPNSLH